MFVPLSTVAFASLPAHLRTEGTAILTLVRNIGSSIGISMVIAQLDQHDDAQCTRSSPNTSRRSTMRCSNAGRRALLDIATDSRPRPDGAIVIQQATIIAYANDFKLLMLLTLATLPLVLVIGRARAPRQASRRRDRGANDVGRPLRPPACMSSRGRPRAPLHDTIDSGNARSIRPRQAEHVLGEIRQDQVGRDRRHRDRAASRGTCARCRIPRRSRSRHGSARTCRPPPRTRRRPAASPCWLPRRMSSPAS